MKKLLLSLSVLLLLGGTALAFENITPAQAYFMATTDPGAYLLDVRTVAEWEWVGHPGKNRLGEGALLDGKVVNISYKIDYKKNFITNPSFLSDVKEVFPKPNEVVLILLCRSGQRSAAAAQDLEAAGYTVYNLATGFEGSADAAGYRTRNGWKNDGLPYSFVGAGYKD